MSGSYDRPPPGPGPAPHAPRPAQELEAYYDEVVTGSVTGTPTHAPGPYASHAGPHAPHPGPYAEPQTGSADPYSEPPRPRLEAGPRPDIYAPARAQSKAAEQFNAPIVPAGSVTGRSLNLVIAIMSFLACLTAGAVYMINQSADAWLRDIASEITVQVEPKDKIDTDKTIKDVSAYLTKQFGIRSVTALDVEASSQLLEPWLGKADVLKTLPVPRLIAIEIDRTTPPDLDQISKGLEQQFQGVTLDDHRRWQRQIRTVTRSFALGGLAILLLVGMATMAIIVSAARSAMASNREIVEVLHFVGATDRFIAREFEKHFLRLGIRAGILGAVLAMAVFFLMPTAMQLLGGGSMTLAEMQQLIGTGALDIAGYVLLGIVVVVVAALCMLTSRLGVFRILKGKH